MNEQDNKKALKRQYKQQQLDEFRQSLPMSVVLFEQLFDFLDKNLDEESVADFNLTQQFCIENEVDFEPLKNWLVGNGTGDDSEVLWNLEEQFEKL
ncbi:DUF2695 domain-containing protein [Spirosoma fluviale]|uniref:Uncharacterized protein n=1 Tax=Spirosoma fluviale TaxID=1597977 RepID=A0A286FER2_9BACT|nr:DUF2695 domain-containing protein [Spirosoma fluviale]SOD81683.1 Protein of unknown function [Spirosoma fluviale]